MALDAKDIPITREEVAQWIADYHSSSKKYTLRDWLIANITKKKLPDTDLDTSQRDDFAADATPLVDIIMADLPSYAGNPVQTG